jgi:uncharacterized glyoxalase superfamily protein PhnB
MQMAPYLTLDGTTRDAFDFSLHVDKPADAKSLFEAMSEGGQVTMAMETTFWAERFGMLFDLFGVSWILNAQATAVPAWNHEA